MTQEPYDEERAANALAMISNGKVPSEFCCDWEPTVPSNAACIELWANADPVFATRLIEAKRIGASVMVADCIRIASDRSYKPDERRQMIEARKYLAALWSSDMNPKHVIEQTTTVKSVTPRETYIDEMAFLFGMSREKAAARYDREARSTMQ